MVNNEKNKCVEELKRWLASWTGCGEPHDGWPCGACTRRLFASLGAVEDDAEHNEPVDRVNEVWRAIIQIRENENSEYVEVADSIEWLRNWLVDWTGCEIQHIDEETDTGWPCGTCVCQLLADLGVDEADAERYEPIDRANEVWRAIDQIKLKQAGGDQDG